MKKSILAMLLLGTLSIPAFASEEQRGFGSIEVCIGQVRSSEGVVGVALFNTSKGFPENKGQALEGRSVQAGNRCIVLFENVPYGTYAVSVLHDENGNGKMDKVFPGIPKEGFGTSNNPKLKMGPPSFDDSRFELDRRQLTLNIDMKYLRKPEQNTR